MKKFRKTVFAHVMYGLSRTWENVPILSARIGTYFDASLQRWTLRRLLTRLRPGGLLVLGAKEALPPGDGPLHAVDASLPLYRHRL